MYYKSCEIFHEEIYQYVGNTNSQILHSLSGISFPDPRYEIERKLANHYSIEYIYSGEGAIQQDGKVQKVGPGDFFILSPNHYHHYFTSPKNPWKKIFFTVDGDPTFLKTLLRLYGIEDVFYLPETNNPFHLDDIFYLIKNDNNHIHHDLEKLVFSMVVDIAAHIKAMPVKNSSMSLVAKFIDKRITTRLTVEEICKEFQIPRNYLYKEFKKAYDISPAQYIINQKIEQAKILLSTTALTVSDIAAAFAFNDAAHFSHTFLTREKMTPSEYRRAYPK